MKMVNVRNLAAIKHAWIVMKRTQNYVELALQDVTMMIKISSVHFVRNVVVLARLEDL